VLAGWEGQLPGLVGPEHLEVVTGDLPGRAVDLAAGPAATAEAEGSVYPGLGVDLATVGVDSTEVETADAVGVSRPAVDHAETEGSHPAPRACWEVAPKHAGEYVGRAAHYLPEPVVEPVVGLALAGKQTSVAA
jgi:hypothetical protein